METRNDSGDLEACRYEYLIALHLHRTSVDHNDGEAYRRDEMHAWWPDS